jgi:hypothetical protein
LKISGREIPSARSRTIRKNSLSNLII